MMVCGINDDAKREKVKRGGESEERGGKEGAKRHVKGHSAPNPVSSSVVSRQSSQVAQLLFQAQARFF